MEVTACCMPQMYVVTSDAIPVALLTNIATEWIGSIALDLQKGQQEHER
jgi:hypothetical protein